MFSKKMVFLAVLVMVLICTGTGFAQEMNSVSLDLFPLFKGFLSYDSDTNYAFFCFALGYERTISPHFGLCVYFDLFPGKVGYEKPEKEEGKISYMYVSGRLGGRYYPMSEYSEKFFLGASLGINRQSVDGKSKPERGGFTGLIVDLQAGYKLVLPPKIYVEPSMSYVLSKSGNYPGVSVTPLGWQGGLRVGYTF